MRVGIASVLRAFGFPRISPAARELIASARIAAAERRFVDAAFFYEEALRLRPGRSAWQIQAGHMRKEAGDYPTAEAHYLAALARRPRDADLAFQLGHFYKLRTDLTRAEAEYRRAASLKPGWSAPVQELLALQRAGWRGAAALPSDHDQPSESRLHGAIESETRLAMESEDAFSTAIGTQGLLPKLTPKPLHMLIHAHSEELQIRRLGNREDGYWGMRRTLRGVQAIRGSSAVCRQ